MRLAQWMVAYALEGGFHDGLWRQALYGVSSTYNGAPIVQLSAFSALECVCKNEGLRRIKQRLQPSIHIDTIAVCVAVVPVMDGFSRSVVCVYAASVAVWF